MDQQKQNALKKPRYYTMESIEMQLDSEREKDKKGGWNKLDKTTRLIILQKHIDQVLLKQFGLTKAEGRHLQSFFNELLDDKKLQYVKDVRYNNLEGKVTEIPDLQFDPVTRVFTFRGISFRPTKTESASASASAAVTTSTLVVPCTPKLVRRKQQIILNVGKTSQQKPTARPAEKVPLNLKKTMPALRKYHNYVKKMLLVKTAAAINKSNHGNVSLIDLGVGTAGDAWKWYDAKYISIVLGVDNELYCSLDEARKRHESVTAEVEKTQGCLAIEASFIHADVSMDEIQAPMTYDICSMQFSIHYCFRHAENVANLLSNVARLTNVGGYFIGTGFDGRLIYETMGDKLTTADGSWQLTKAYNNPSSTSSSRIDTLPPGMPIDVSHSGTIKEDSLREWLVDYTFLKEQLAGYGFYPLTVQELYEDVEWNQPSIRELVDNGGHGSFRLLRENYQGPALSADEALISDLNTYFIFKKAKSISY